MKMLDRNTIFTNCAMTPEGDVWWEGMSEPPKSCVSWLRTEWNPTAGVPAAHPNARFTVPLTQCPSLDPEWNNVEGVPISGIIFGGRRSSKVPLIFQARDWNHGVFMGATMSSETTAAAAGKRGVLRQDPFAMMPFCGYNMADYFNHWLSFNERTSETSLPNIFHVNWFRKNQTGKFMWPGFGDNIRVLEWIFNRCDQKENLDKGAVSTALGWVPKKESLNLSGLNINDSTMEELLTVNNAEFKSDVNKHYEFLSTFGNRLPKEISNQLDEFSKQLGSTAGKKSEARQ